VRWEALGSEMQSLTLAQQAEYGRILMQFAPILIIAVVFYLLIFMPPIRRLQIRAGIKKWALRSQKGSQA
jgi:hypothetical protein